jgi:3-phosphoshikimate 1-carboxyvinyltransferase
MLLPDLLPVVPFTRPVRGSLRLPGSKSLTNRALLLAAMSPTPVRLEGALASEDTVLMAAALRALGISVVADASGTTVDVSGQDRAFSTAAPGQPVELFVGLAGTAARFLTAYCATAPGGTYRIDGVAQMRRRPMRPRHSAPSGCACAALGRKASSRSKSRAADWLAGASRWMRARAASSSPRCS